MKRILGLIFFLFLVGLVWGENLYQYNSLGLELEVEGKFNLKAEKEGAKVESMEVELNLYPEEDFRQKLQDWQSQGKVEGKKVVFEWKDKELGEKEYGFQAGIKTEDKRIEIKEKVSFPLAETKGYEEYLKATETIDKDNPKIIEKATELAEGEDELFRVIFKLARWVEENVNYELDTLTAEASQKASWVLEQRRGVCDEISSLFIAMCRTLGIPARFVSGVSYTTSELFAEPWLPHGWAEVYFPEYGWVSFDLTFGEYGYVDVTHIRLREGTDPREASTKFEWLADKVKLESEELKFLVKVREKGERGEEEIILREEILGKEVGLESYNLIKGTIENKKEHYIATTLKIAVPEEIKIVGQEKKVILLEPRETKEVSWVIKVKEGLREDYWYEFPIVIYSEKNVSVKEKFKVVKGGIFYAQKEVEALGNEEEEKRYLGKIGLDCEAPKEIRLGEEKEVRCVIKNKGNVNLKKLEFCLGGICKETDLGINQEMELEIKVKGKEAGWQKLRVSGKNELGEKKISLEYKVLDEPKIALKTKGPEVVDYGKKFELWLEINRTSFSLPKKIVLTLEGKGFENRWEMEELKEKEELVLEMGSKRLGKENEFKAKLGWEDESGKKFKGEQTIKVKVKGKTFGEKAIMLINGIINWLG